MWRKSSHQILSKYIPCRTVQWQEGASESDRLTIWNIKLSINLKPLEPCLKTWKMFKCNVNLKIMQCKIVQCTMVSIILKKFMSSYIIYTIIFIKYMGMWVVSTYVCAYISHICIHRYIRKIPKTVICFWCLSYWSFFLSFFFMFLCFPTF